MAVRPQLLTLTPRHAGRRMSLARFAAAEGAPGHIYELERGIVQAVDVPGVPHARLVRFLRRALEAYADDNPERVNLIAGSHEMVLRMPEIAAERHPDLAVYLSPPPTDAEQPWDVWTPDIVVEVVSASSRRRDYVTKRADYLAAGVRQYWIIDLSRRSVSVLTRRGDTWSPAKRQATGELRTGLLPGFALELKPLFDVGLGG